MTTYAAKRVADRARRPPVSAGVRILAAKITAPGVPDWAIPRPRITKLIAEGRRWCPLTAVTAPAGAGKTMALALWAAAEPGTVAWVTVDEFDNRPGVFWAYLVAALRQSGVAVPAAPPAARGRATGHVFLLGLASALAAQDPPVTLVLDDLHLLTDPTVLDGLDYVLRNAGSGLRLVVAARMDPLPLHRYRLAGELAQIRASDLAFTIDEAGLLLTLAYARAAAGDGENARRVLAPVLATHSGAPDPVRLQARLVDARLSYHSGDRARGCRSLASALRLAEPEQLRLPFALERGWIEPVLRRDPELADVHRSLFSPAGRHDQLPAPSGAPKQAAILVVEPLIEREREVLRHVSGLAHPRPRRLAAHLGCRCWRGTQAPHGSGS
jgi:hypothetical protein